jgi:hypothetical protein
MKSVAFDSNHSSLKAVGLFLSCAILLKPYFESAILLIPLTREAGHSEKIFSLYEPWRFGVPSLVPSHVQVHRQHCI